MSRNRKGRIAISVLGLMLLAQPAGSQAPAGQRPASPLESSIEAAARSAQPSGQVGTLVYANRPIVEFHATVLSRTPAERAAAAVNTLDRLVSETPWARVTTSPLANGRMVSVGDRAVFAILPPDVDELEGETVDSKASEAAARLQVAFDEAVELHTPSRLFKSGLLALFATLNYIAALWLLRRTHRATASRLTHSAERQLERLPGGAILIAVSRAPDFVRHALTFAWGLLALLATDAWLIFVLRRFPYTRPLGDSLRASVFSTLLTVGQGVVGALPGLFIVMIIVLITRFAVRQIKLLFQAVEEGRLSIPGVYPETALPTRRIVVALLWLFALVMSYNYLPGSESEVFKGVSVFVGLIVSLGSSGIMNQIMSGLTITYSRALRLGDFVKVGDAEGTVTHLGTLATKIKTQRREEITIPNAVLVSSATTNFSRHAEAEGVFVPTSLTIGYDAPWRQVEALLLLAAGRTPGVRSKPEPVVRQTALQDFYVHYTLLVCLEQPHLRSPVLDALHANIQDAFNEFGVQIMSPAYESDPSGPKVVARDRWYAAPAVKETDQKQQADAGNRIRT